MCMRVHFEMCFMPKINQICLSIFTHGTLYSLTIRSVLDLIKIKLKILLVTRKLNYCLLFLSIEKASTTLPTFSHYHLNDIVSFYFLATYITHAKFNSWHTEVALFICNKSKPRILHLFTVFSVKTLNILTLIKMRNVWNISYHLAESEWSKQSLFNETLWNLCQKTIFIFFKYCLFTLTCKVSYGHYS